MGTLPERLVKAIADELDRVGEWGRVVLHVRAGSVSRIEGTRSTLVVGEEQREHGAVRKEL